jgi:hypothetical protein
MSTTSFESLITSTPKPEGIQAANLHWADYVVIIGYFIGILGVGFWV